MMKNSNKRKILNQNNKDYYSSMYIIRYCFVSYQYTIAQNNLYIWIQRLKSIILNPENTTRK